jgi:hypothetical protein
MNSPSWRPLNSPERGRGERVDSDRALGFTIVFECLSLPFVFFLALKVPVGQTSDFNFTFCLFAILHNSSVGE